MFTQQVQTEMGEIMKKTLFLFISLIIVLSQIDIVYAKERTIHDYKQMLNELNEQYETHLYIMDEMEYNLSDYKTNSHKSYDEYISSILSMNTKDFEKECLFLIESTLNSESIEVNLNDNVVLFSTQASQTTYFNDNRNTMTLTYKYTGSGSSKKFDTSYKPTVSVSATAKGLNSSYFRMLSYTGSFLNSNTSYKVTATGNIYSKSGLVSSGATFNVTFHV